MVRFSSAALIATVVLLASNAGAVPDDDIARCQAVAAGHKSLDHAALAACSRLCSRDSAPACEIAANAYETQRSAEGMARAVKLYVKACDLGLADACFNAGRFYVHGWQVKRDPARAAAIWRRGCDGKDWTSCARLAERYQLGDGVPKDSARAARLARASCDHACVRGCVELGEIFSDAGRLTDAAQQYQRGCAGDDPDGCVGLGRAYEYGDGVPKDPARAVELARKACRPPYYGGGCESLGRYYERGFGVPQDFARAAQMFGEACNADAPQSCYWLAGYYLRGRGVPLDRSRALALLKRGCETGLQEACDQLPALVNPDGFARTIAALRESFEACYRQYKVAGQDSIALTVDPNGAVAGVSLKGTLPSDVERQCAIAAVREARFPAAPAKWNMTLPLFLP